MIKHLRVNQRNEEKTMQRQFNAVLGAGVLCLAAFWPAAGVAQQKTEVKEKPPMYSYIANWELPREKAKDMEGVLGSNNALMTKLVGDGTVIGFGNDITLVHKAGESTHDIWWSSMSMGNLMKALQAVKA